MSSMRVPRTDHMGAWPWSMYALSHKFNALLWWGCVWRFFIAFLSWSESGALAGRRYPLSTCAKIRSRYNCLWKLYVIFLPALLKWGIGHESKYWCFVSYRISSRTVCCFVDFWQGFGTTWIARLVCRASVITLLIAPLMLLGMPVERIYACYEWFAPGWNASSAE